LGHTAGALGAVVDLLERHEVRIEGADQLGDALQIQNLVVPCPVVDVVGQDAQGRRFLGNLLRPCDDLPMRFLGEVDERY
jgi:hypothetical protein